ncbi:MAG: response regulator [bacterium]
MRTLFFVDDDDLMREIVTRLLEKNHYVVRAFRSPVDALDAIHVDYPDVLITDVQMPEMSGLELARLARERDAALPVVLVTAHPTPEVEKEADGLGVLHVFKKPLRDVSQLCTVLRGAIARRDEARTLAGFDQLRLSFLTGLAHELRTPLTAIKLALDSLFGAHTAGLPPAQGRLVSIGQRNLDRIIRLVEGQLDLLQITLGDVSVSRRLVVLSDVLRRAVAGASPGVRRSLITDDPICDRPVFLFSDPQRLCAVVQYILESGSSSDRRPRLRVLPLAADVTGDVVLEFENIRFPRLSPGKNGSTVTQGANGGGVLDAVAEGGFEARAFGRLVESLAGEIRTADDGAGSRVRLVVPMCPPFDGELDFVASINGLREAAMLSGKTVTILKCRVGGAERSGSVYSQADVEFFEKCTSALSDGDALVRSRNPGSYYLVLIERRDDEIQHIVEFLGRSSTGNGEGRTAIEVLRSLPPESGLGEDLVVDLETVM